MPGGVVNNPPTNVTGKITIPIVFYPCGCESFMTMEDFKKLKGLEQLENDDSAD